MDHTGNDGQSDKQDPWKYMDKGIRERLIPVDNKIPGKTLYGYTARKFCLMMWRAYDELNYKISPFVDEAWKTMNARSLVPSPQKPPKEKIVSRHNICKDHIVKRFQISLLFFLCYLWC
jgi:hypothetical protein